MASVHAMAKAAAAVVPFHCIICFETFSTDEHPPVVLPCGHTYVCLPCSKRLKRCMECREPLYWTPPASSQVRAPPLMPMHATRMRAVGVRNPPSPPQASLLPNKPEQIPLPAPKNLVLLAMMEAAEQQARIMTLRNAASIETDYESDGDEPQDDITQQACVRLGIGALSGSCGTYAVREAEGLAVLPFDPRRGVNHSGEEKKSDEPREPFTIIKGQTVQVVSFEGGVAKLARGEGYIVASEQQLVKVGGPLERSCQLEGLLCSVEVHRMEMQAKVEEIRRLEQSLRWQVDMEQLSEPSQPVVADPPPLHEFVFIEEPKNNQERPPSPPDAQLGPHLAEEVVLSPHSPKDSYLVDSMDHLTFFGGCGGCSPQRVVKLSPNTIVHCDVEHLPAFTRTPFRRSTSEDDVRSLAFGCGSSLFGDNESHGKNGDGVSGLSFDSMEENAPPRLAHSATGQDYRGPLFRNLNTSTSHLQQSPSFDNINFRTGMSGHRGLSSAKATSPRGKMLMRTEIRMMSEHRGIAHVRGAARARGGSTSPSLGGRSSPHTHGSG